MSRRDTIIIAVLVNACLLVILFATSITKKGELQYASSHEAPLSVPVPTLQFEDIERALVQETKSLEEAFPLQPKITAPAVVAPKIIAKAEEPKPKSIEPAEKDYIEVTVKSGDYLDRIGRENNVTVAEIMRFNHLKNTQLRIGQILKIPRKLGANAPVLNPVKQYVVKVGDTPWKIANDHQMRLDDLLKLNHLDKESSKQLKPGDTLYIR